MVLITPYSFFGWKLATSSSGNSQRPTLSGTAFVFFDVNSGGSLPTVPARDAEPDGWFQRKSGLVRMMVRTVFYDSDADECLHYGLVLDVIGKHPQEKPASKITLGLTATVWRGRKKGMLIKLSMQRAVTVQLSDMKTWDVDSLVLSN